MTLAAKLLMGSKKCNNGTDVSCRHASLVEIERHNVGDRGQSLMFFFTFYRADFSVFRPTGAIPCTDQGEIWQGERTLRLLLSATVCQISKCNVLCVIIETKLCAEYRSRPMVIFNSMK